MNVSQLSLSDLVGQTEIAIRNLRANPEMLPPLSEYRIDAASIDEAATALAALQAEMVRQVDLGGLQGKAKDAREDERKRHHDKVYMPMVRLARRVFRKDPHTLARLGLKGRRAANFNAWIGQAINFYDVAVLPGVLSQLERRGITREKVVAARAEIDALRTLQSDHRDAKGLTEQSSRDKRDASTVVRDWLAELQVVAEIAYADQPEWIERLGFDHRS